MWTQAQSGEVVIVTAAMAEYSLTLLGTSSAATWLWQICDANSVLFQGQEPDRASAIQTVQTVLKRLHHGS